MNASKFPVAIEAMHTAKIQMKQFNEVLNARRNSMTEEFEEWALTWGLTPQHFKKDEQGYINIATSHYYECWKAGYYAGIKE